MAHVDMAIELVKQRARAAMAMVTLPVDKGDAQSPVVRRPFSAQHPEAASVATILPAPASGPPEPRAPVLAPVVRDGSTWQNEADGVSASSTGELANLRAQLRQLESKAATQDQLSEAGHIAGGVVGVTSARYDQMPHPQGKPTSWRRRFTPSRKSRESPTTKQDSEKQTSEQLELGHENDMVPHREEWAAPRQRCKVCYYMEVAAALLFLLVVVALFLGILAFAVCSALLNVVQSKLLQAGAVRLVVNTLYVSRLGMVREWLIRSLRRCTRRCREHDDHSVSLRVDVPLPQLPLAEQPLTEQHDGQRYSTSTEHCCSIHTIAMMSDNYAYLIVDRSSRKKPYPAALVDPADSAVCMREMHRIEIEQYGGDPQTVGKGLQLTALLITHKHWDHAGGNRDLVKFWATIPNALQSVQVRAT
jgi:hypothetical protein